MARTLTVQAGPRYVLQVARPLTYTGDNADVLHGDGVWAAGRKEQTTGLTNADSVQFAGLEVVSVVSGSMPERNLDVVDAGAYATLPTSGAGDFGGSGAMTSREFFFYFHTYRLRQAGTVAKFSVYVGNTTGLTGLYLKIWRRAVDDNLWDLIGTSENLAGALSAGSINALTLGTPITGCEEGDYWSVRMEWSGGTAAANLGAAVGVTGAITYRVQNATPATTNYDWLGATAGIAGSILPVKVGMQAPHVVGIGDSNMAGHAHNYSFIEGAATPEGTPNDLDGTALYGLCNARVWTYQNMGIGSQTSAQVAARFAADCVAIKPRLAVIQCGVNDIALGTVSAAGTLSNWTSMMAACRANGILALFVGIGPWTGGSNIQCADMDARNASLQALVAANSDIAAYVQLGATLGQFRPTGPVDNLWDIQPAYLGTGNVHFNAAGHALAGEAFYNAIIAAGILEEVTVISRLGATETLLITPVAAPADADMTPGQVGLWLDVSGNALQVKAAYPDGVTFKSGSIALT